MHGSCRRVIVPTITHVCVCDSCGFLCALLLSLCDVFVVCVMFLGWGVMGKVFLLLLSSSFFFLFLLLFFYCFVCLFVVYFYFFISSFSVPDLSLVVIVNLLTRRE